MQDFEKLGAFYLGKVVDTNNSPTEELLLYDSRDMTTHSVIIGMTGSGKTGLGLSLLEEAAMDSIPVIAVDPKGDLANLLLTFPDLAPHDFRPWVDEAEAGRLGISADELAAQKAADWQKGLTDWGQSGERIRSMREKVEMAVYTPGGSSGLAISVLKSFDAPSADVLGDQEALQNLVGSTVSGLLGLLEIDADPLRSREYILLSNIINAAWQEGRSLDMPSLIAEIQKPPFDQIGVVSLGSFFPEKDRFALAMQINNLLASPSFAAWTRGDPLDINKLLYTKDGKPRMSIISIAHLGDTERQFFVSMLLGATLSWMRTQSGTSSLRAMLYMDEVAGYFPPNSNPPSKQPMMTLLKQARAFGLGITLATQNPVDLDYKGLSNIGTWMIGRLQTENDKARIIEALQGANRSKSELDKLLNGLGKRVFLMHNVHESEPVLFTTRWTMSYLAGPVTGSGIKQLMSSQKAAAPATSSVALPDGAKQIIPTGVPEVYLPTSETDVVYHPQLLAVAQAHYSSVKQKIDLNKTISLLLEPTDSVIAIDWQTAEEINLDTSALETSPAEGASFAKASEALLNAKNYAKWSKEAAKHIAANKPLRLLKDPFSGISSSAGESEGDFKIRATHAGREMRDAAVEDLRAKYASKIATLEERLQKAQIKVGQQQAQAQQAQLQTAMNIGVGILGALFGGGRKSGIASMVSSGASGAGRAMREGQDVQSAQAEAEAVQAQLARLQQEVQEEIDALQLGASSQPETLDIKAKSSDVSVQLVALAWVPFKKADSGLLSPAWDTL